MYVEGREGKRDKYNYERIIDIDDNEEYESDNTYIDKLLSGKEIQGEVNPKDIYFCKNNDNFTIGIIYKVDNNEVKMYCNGLSEWWAVDELSAKGNFYRIEDFNIFMEFINLTANTLDDARQCIEIYSE